MLAYEGEVMLVQTEGEMARALNFLKKETLLGFDTESRPSFKKGKSYPTSLIQLAGSELVVLIRLNLTPFCGALAGLLADPGIIKAGVAIRDDIRALQKLHEFTPGGLADLAEMAKQRGIKAPGPPHAGGPAHGLPYQQGRAMLQLGEKDPHAAADPLCRHRCVDRPGNLFTYDGSGVKSGEGTLLKKGISLPSPRPPLPPKTFDHIESPFTAFPHGERTG